MYYNTTSIGTYDINCFSIEISEAFCLEGTQINKREEVFKHYRW